MDKNSPIVLFDSGVGGLTIAKEIMTELSNEKIIYFGDTAHLPYGTRLQSEVEGFALQIMDYFVDLGAKMVIIACNTATAASLKLAQDRFNIPIIGPIKAGAKEAIIRTENNKIGVIATTGTIESSAYQNVLKELGFTGEVFAQACPKLVPLVEKGELYSQRARRVVSEYLTSLKEVEIDTLLLGCTHFPYLARLLEEIMGKDVNLIYPGRVIALQVRNYLVQKDLLGDTNRQNSFYVSDLDNLSHEFLEVGREFLGFEKLEFKELDLWG